LLFEIAIVLCSIARRAGAGRLWRVAFVAALPAPIASAMGFLRLCRSRSRL